MYWSASAGATRPPKTHRKKTQAKKSPAKNTGNRRVARPKAFKVTPMPVVIESDGKVRINKFLASAGICSRRAADELIRAGRVSVNRQMIKELGTRSILVHLQSPLASVPDNLCCLGAELIDDGRVLLLTLAAGQNTGDLLHSLCALGLPIADLEIRQASLEKIFLQITQSKRTAS